VFESSTPGDRIRLAHALGIAPAELEARLRHAEPFVWLARRIAPDRADAATALGIDGVGALSEYKRFYPESNLAASVVGLAGMDGQGLSGLELQYDRIVRGEPIELRFYHDAFGHPILDSPVALRTPEPGAELMLTIDSSIQSLAETELASEVEQSGAKRGSAIVLDPFTGEVLALANVSSTPEGVHDRLHDPAVQDTFEPGSTMKGLLGSIALSDGTITTDRKIYCEDGQFRVDRRTIHDDSRHSWLDLGGIIEVSSNIGAAKIALALGPDKFCRGLRSFGLGSRTDIDLPGEAAGLLRKPSTWREIDLANHGFGQGIAVTPIQLAVAYAAIANGGMILRPYVVKSAVDAEGRPLLTHEPEVVRRAISPAVAHTMNGLLRNVVYGADGTGRRARVDGFEVAGKTGTAQMVNPDTGAYYQNRHVASFVGFLPADDPRLLILVVLYDVGQHHFGGVVAAPVFSEIASGAVRDLDIASENPPLDLASMLPLPKVAAVRRIAPAAKSALNAKPIEDPNATPNFIGMSLRAALELAHERGVMLDVSGAGYVVAQDPAPDADPQGSITVKLTFAPAGDSDSPDGIRPVALSGEETSSGNGK
jgi:cell division protein FtsI (penicillin-binding protein 3)